jgi:predicted nucleic-acid-binding protein
MIRETDQVNSVKTARIIDTNVILRYILADHEEHYHLARDFMLKVKNGTSTAFVPESVVVECVYVLLKVYRVPRVEISAQLGALLAYRGVMMDDKPVMLTALQVFAEQNVGMVDAWVFALSEARNWPLMSFDRALNKLKQRSSS